MPVAQTLISPEAGAESEQLYVTPGLRIVAAGKVQSPVLVSSLVSEVLFVAPMFVTFSIVELYLST